ncbi:MAG: hypothetical protein IT447_09905 [Phycisphaerales bacterium]|jgi:hypothetical protein|nr:hypothetical protein [Phycisphaerales bacterium]
MAYEEWSQIPPEEQLREVSVILAAGLLRVHRHSAVPPAIRRYCQLGCRTRHQAGGA